MLNRLAKGLKEDESVDDENELSETALSTLEAIIRKCPVEVGDYIDELVSSAFQLCEYDPNYQYNEEEDGDEEMKDAEEEGWGDDDFSDGGDIHADDDDTSWKVRRAAVTIIDTIVKTRPAQVKPIIQRYSDKMISRIKERIDDVKIEVLNTMQSIIKSTMELNENDIEKDLKAQTSVMRQLSVGEDLKAKQPIVVKSLLKPMSSKNIKVKVAAIETLSAYALLSQFNFDLCFDQVWPELKTTIDDDSHFEPVISALGVLRRMFRSKNLTETRKGNFTEATTDITAFLKKSIEHNYSKVVFEGLRVASSFLNALRSPSTGTVE